MQERQIDLREKMAYSVDETAAIMGLSRPVICDLVHSDGFPSFKIGRRTLVSADGLREWIAARVEAERGA